MISLLITIALVGLVAWAITYFVPMAPKFKTAIYVGAGVWVILHCLEHFSLYHGKLPGVDLLIYTTIVGLVAWALTYFIPMPEKLKVAIYVIAAVGLLFYCLVYFGLWHGMPKGLR